MRPFPIALITLLLLIAGCSDDSANPDKTSGDPTSPPKIMIDSREYESLTAFLGDQRAGFVILHQLRAPGEDLTDGEDPVTPVLAATQFVRAQPPQLHAGQARRRVAKAMAAGEVEGRGSALKSGH